MSDDSTLVATATELAKSHNAAKAVLARALGEKKTARSLEDLAVDVAQELIDTRKEIKRSWPMLRDDASAPALIDRMFDQVRLDKAVEGTRVAEATERRCREELEKTLTTVWGGRNRPWTGLLSAVEGLVSISAQEAELRDKLFSIAHMVGLRSEKFDGLADRVLERARALAANQPQMIKAWGTFVVEQSTGDNVMLRRTGLQRDRPADAPGVVILPVEILKTGEETFEVRAVTL